MSCWHFRSELASCPGLAAGLAISCLAAAALPWIAGVPLGPALLLSALALAPLPAALRSVPGRGCAFTAVAHGSGGLSLPPATGTLRVLPSTRVFPELVLLRAELDGRRQVLWIPRAALPPADFRRLKVALRALRPGAVPPA
ncbi:MAG: hypothetical protein MUC71_12355 [Steroidobacteraceae bacterium]|jgi:hypothetical protein|nr:hypothetical protein [Steroidobacteraceae bacterium]